ncbi:MAG: hypothetical protein GF411_06265 [Candidatus Lokiarchaeota archaeon]|nr:hypothetical protein [Candidatus Lokiarchaeota archaeon]
MPAYATARITAPMEISDRHFPAIANLPAFGEKMMFPRVNKENINATSNGEAAIIS